MRDHPYRSPAASAAGRSCTASPAATRAPSSPRCARRGCGGLNAPQCRTLSTVSAPPPPTDVAHWRRRIALVAAIWRETFPAAGTLVEIYLRSRHCWIEAPAPPIRFHPALWHRESGRRWPAMVGLVEHALYGPAAAHATFLMPDGRGKAPISPPRKSFGPISGAAVRLAPCRGGDWLVVGEGIETALACMIATGLSAWAALSAGGIARLVLPPEARTVVIAADNDVSGIGERDARKAAARWLAEGRRVRIAMPPEPGTDFADVLLGRPYARIREVRGVAA